jgi:hypothetical protein
MLFDRLREFEIEQSGGRCGVQGEQSTVPRPQHVTPTFRQSQLTNQLTAGR